MSTVAYTPERTLDALYRACPFIRFKRKNHPSSFVIKERKIKKILNVQIYSLFGMEIIFFVLCFVRTSRRLPRLHLIWLSLLWPASGMPMTPTVVSKWLLWTKSMQVFVFGVTVCRAKLTILYYLLKIETFVGTYCSQFTY